MENALYYTLSTIAQTLAGALAVLVAFVVFWRSNVDSDIRQGRSLLGARYSDPDPDSFLAVLCEKGLQALEEHLTSERKTPLQGWASTPDRHVLAAAHAAYQKRPRVTRRLYVALAFSTVAIALCFVVLPFTPLLGRHRLLAGSLLCVAVVLGLVCLGLYVWLIQALMRA